MTVFGRWGRYIGSLKISVLKGHLYADDYRCEEYEPGLCFTYHGEALDKKTPLLRSLQALSRQVCRLSELFGIPCEGRRAMAALGCEQEYFLVDKEFYEDRPDLVQTGRTLFGRRPAKHQQMEDHYFGAIKRRVLAFMEDLDRELWKLGVPAKTRHNEVCPAQFEIAPMYEELNLAVDQNMLVMQTLQDVAGRHGLQCLLHAKPFAGVNGSGKHNNWNIVGPDGKNWLAPGENPREDAKFLTMICALSRRHARRSPAGLRGDGGERSPSRRQRSAAGDHVHLPRRTARGGDRATGDRRSRTGDGRGRHSRGRFVASAASAGSHR